MANMAQAIRLALHYAEENLELKDVFGEDVGPPLGGVFTATQGIKSAWNSPLDERGWQHLLDHTRTHAAAACGNDSCGSRNSWVCLSFP